MSTLRPVKGRLVKGTLIELRRFCKHKNIPAKWIRKDHTENYYIKMSDRGNKKS